MLHRAGVTDPAAELGEGREADDAPAGFDDQPGLALVRRSDRIIAATACGVALDPLKVTAVSRITGFQIAAIALAVVGAGRV